ncbi:MAG: cell surface protein SprA [Tannerella sp.]|nr:cell surface protein SprA [Tannerella sp.]
MKRRIIYITIIIACVSGIFVMNAGYPALLTDMPVLGIFSPEDVMPDDTIVKPRIPVKKTVPEEYEDLNNNSASDLRDPDNLQTEVEYDLNSGTYLIRSRVGDLDLGTPLRMTPEEYQNYSLKQSLNQYFQDRNRSALDSVGAAGRGGNQFNLMDMQFDLGGADKLFGPGGVRLRSQGTIGLDMGLKTSKTKNPSLPEKSRSRTFFNFDTNVQMNMHASVGTKINFDLNYNTEAAFDFDATKLKLAYAGEEDEILKSLEGGNVSLSTNNSLIRGGSALFGVKTDLQFGKLRVKALLAQQESDSRSVSAKGGSQMTEFEIAVDNYDENRHYFLAYYFRDNYDKAMSKLPYISSPISINRVEVWITNKISSTGQTRNLVAFSDLGEYEHISNPAFTPSGRVNVPYNEANTLYRTIVDNYPGAREISSVTQTLEGFLEGGLDYEKVESARMLSPSEYKFNAQLGYISLNSKLQADEVLAVAFEYTYNGDVYQVGEFSSDKTENTNQCLFLKVLKGTSLSPSMPFWDLMMKNIYSLNAYSIQKTKFRLDIVYQSDTAGTYVYTIPEGNIKDQTLLKVMSLDRLNSNNEVVPGGSGDGFFDYVEGYTIISNNGRIVFPVVEPFGSHLREKIGNDEIADKYVYQELYDSTLTVAKQIAEKNKFLLRGQYTGSASNVIQLGATNVARGSVVVRANGIILTENVDYIVNYSSGTVTILNENLISSNASINVSLENQSTFSTQRKTMFGADLNYEFSKNFNMGATIMHLSEMPLTTKTTLGDESVKNTLWGVNLDYKGQSQWLTNMFDKLPLLSLTQPSSFSVNAEFAHLIAGHYQNKYTGEYSYLDDFESTQSEFDLLNPYFWNLASTPYDNNKTTELFPEAGLVNNVDYGKNRALLAWYYVDGIFTRKNSSLRPSYMTNDDISNHYVRAVQSKELFPDRDLGTTDNNYLNVLNLAYYPNERGPYNLDADNINSDGSLMYPEKRWGGMMRSLDQTDFETANIQYIEFWVMDPFIYDSVNAKGGDLYFNLGEISEDILKDEKKFFENGLPVDGDMSQVDTTVWGKVPKQQSTVYAFDNTTGTRRLQDVGFNGLSSEEERSRNGSFPAYDEFLDKLERNLSPEVIQQMQNDPLSPFNDPATDNYRYFRGSDYDREQADILTRYKRYNGVEGNSAEAGDSQESYSTSATMLPDVEDFNKDNTLNENEKYYQYKVSIRPEDMEVGMNYIVDKRTSNVRLLNGKTEQVTWYQFKIPIKDYSHKVGTISDFSSIRFMRTFMTGFEKTTILRFGKFSLVRGEWRPYEQALYKSDAAPSVNGSLSVSTINIEENSDRQPINYMLPPGVSRITDPSQPQLRQQNEQSLSLKVENLASLDARAVYKRTSYDLRRYKRMQLFVHAEKLVDDVTSLESGDLSIFVRLGSDYKNNYYEYEIPLNLTPFGSTKSDEVWLSENMFNFTLETFTDLKLERNRAKSSGEGVTYGTLYSKYDPNNTRNTISIIGNPALSEVQVIMIGIRNNSGDTKSAEVWINELRVTDFDESGGWAANTNMNLAISDFATINATGSIETAGFGGLEQSVSERSLEDYKQFSIATTVQLGKLFPKKVRVSLPLYYAYSKEVTSPQYNPLDQDIILQEAIDNEPTKAGKDSIRSFSNDVLTTNAFALNNVRVDVRSKKPMPYDPANFSMGYASNVEKRTNPETEYETTKNYQGNLGYSYSPYVKPLKPFGKVKDHGGYTKYIKQLAFYYLPSSISLQNTITRNYYEIQLRDLNNVNNASQIPVSFSQNFYWDRAFNIRWNPLSNFSLNLNTGTNARIEEGYLQVNKNLNRDDYEKWKDTVMKSIADLGTPLLYDQNFTATYTPPFQQIPILDWITGSVSYKATYNWERGSYVDEETIIGNSVKNQRVIDLQGSLNLTSLYNKNDFLKKVNQKSNVKKSATTPKSTRSKNRWKPLEMEITLSLDSGVIVTHNMLTKHVLINARLANDSTKRYKVSYKALDFARVRITNRDTVSLKLSIRPAPPREQNFSYKLAEYSARTLMMLRRINIQYTLTDGMYLPGFMPEIGNWFGQSSTPTGRAPGWGFAFGDVRRSFIDDAEDKGWLVNNEDNITPAMINASKVLTGSALIEPLPGLKINLNANYMNTHDTEIQYMYAGMPETRGGTFSMTTIGLGGFFAGSGDARKGYRSDVFQEMLDNRNIIASRIQNRYTGTTYPDAGFISETSYKNTEYSPNNGTVGLNSSDVLIPSFIAAYTNKNPKKVGLTAFPSLSSILPNWNITYDGLMQLPFISQRFKSMSLSHRYNCVYTIGSYNSYLNWVNAGIGGDLGYVRNTETGAPIPSMGYEIASVTLTESFNPLLGIDATFLNNVTAGAKYARNRTINLNATSYQLVEAFTNDITMSLGYKYAEFNKILKMRKKGDFSNDLTVRMDYTRRKALALVRKLEDGYTQATQGTISQTIQFSADYAFSKKVTLRAFYDLQINEPLVSSSSFPTSNSNYGVSIQISLNE